MQRSYGTLAGVLVALGVCLWPAGADALFGKKAKAEPAPPEAASAAPAVSGGEQVVHTFADQAKMDEFARLWQRRQRSVLRITVLESYWNEEQAALQRMNQQLSQDYSLDVNKNYRFDNERKVLVEIPAPAEPASPMPAPEASPVQ